MTDGRWVEVGDRVLVRRYTELDLSVGLVLGDGGCLVVDTRGDAGQGAELATAVREVTRDPWTVVLTHAHFDHCFGTAAFQPCVVWATDGCRTYMANNAIGQRDWWTHQYREWGKPEIAERLAIVEPVLPDRVVKSPTVLTVGERNVKFEHFGAGHTDHDLVVSVPDAGVAFAGDLIEQGAPPSFDDADPLAWPTAVDGILGLEVKIVIPGHGNPVSTTFVAEQRAELAALADLCAGVLYGAHSEEEAVRRSPYPEDVTRLALRRARRQRA